MLIVDLTDRQQKQRAYEKLREEVARVSQTRIIFGLACGDGTILTMLDEAQSQFHIPLNSLQIVALPFGTGNDFA